MDNYPERSYILEKLRNYDMRLEGYSIYQARIWQKHIRASMRCGNDLPNSKKRWAIKHGFMPEYASIFGINRRNYRGFLSEREYRYLAPTNGKYSKWIVDMVSARYIMKKFSDYLPECYYHFYARDGKLKSTPLPDCPEGYEPTLTSALKLIKEKGPLLLSTAKWRRLGVIRASGADFLLDDKPMTRMELTNYIAQSGTYLVLCSVPKTHPELDSLPLCNNAHLRLIVINENGDDPTISDAYYISGDRTEFVNTSSECDDEERYLSDRNIALNKELVMNIDVNTGAFRGGRSSNGVNLSEHEFFPNSSTRIEGVIPNWKLICSQVDSLCRFLPQLEFVAFDIVVTKDGFKIIKIFDFPPFPKMYIFSDRAQNYIKAKYEKKRLVLDNPDSRDLRAYNKMRLLRRQRFASFCYPKGLIPYLSEFWLRDLRNDNRENKSCSPLKKAWAHRNGFISYRLEQYGITKENREEFISDFEYRWLRHINNKYKNWLEDKITVKYIASDFADCFPSYYYYTSLKNGAIKIIPMMDCPDGYGASYDDIFRLVREKGELALKPDEGSHGEGFYRFSYSDGKYFMNFIEVDESFVRGILSNVNNQYLVTEYIKMHPKLLEIYPGSVNTIRLIVFKKDGINPVIGNAYMRIGSKKSGTVDNMGAGGMFARIDIETGRYGDAKLCEHNEILSCPHHPDTGVLIEGYLPNWDNVKEKVLAISRAIPQIEWFGFDLAITEDGIKLPEINRFPDYPKIEKFSPATMDYLLYKLDRKKKLYGYDIARPVKLITLPKRAPYSEKPIEKMQS